MSLSKAIKEIIVETAESLAGYERRHYMARVVKKLYDGSPTAAESELGWNRKTVRKAVQEWDGGFC